MATKKNPTKKQSRRIVLVRSGQSGVWMGVFVWANDDRTSVELTEARKIWRWRGANTTSELALRGPSKDYTRVAEPVHTTISGVCETHESNEAAFAAVNACGWAP